MIRDPVCGLPITELKEGKLDYAIYPILKTPSIRQRKEKEPIYKQVLEEIYHFTPKEKLKDKPAIKY